jgi:DNA-binding MarR family transcriptional regulator
LLIWHSVLTASFGDGNPDLSARQMAVMLDVYLNDAPHTVRGLAERLKISKPAVVRALDVLGRVNYLKRQRDQKDGRNVLIQRTVAGSVFLREFAEHIIEAERDYG